MQFRLPSAFLIFIGSYLPLAVILAIQDIEWAWWSQSICTSFDLNKCVFNPFSNANLSLSFVCITALSLLIATCSFKKISYPYEIEITSVKAIPNDIINYVFPYVVSFMGISYDQPEKLFGFVVFIMWMFAITYKSGQIIMNPVLLIWQWKLYEANIIINGVNREVRILKQGTLVQGHQKAQTIQDFYVVKDY
ncbi:hypothetical protein [Oxalicibacterium faecigallinarum]|uniref:hypothetical protein n=1 Tax=Oxalicibacterium faecigallinarum TaxID=573741 RepID=UPI001663A625|nr:hypothetical protein [Oxalicibacterium faecigallinarum]